MAKRFTLQDLSTSMRTRPAGSAVASADEAFRPADVALHEDVNKSPHAAFRAREGRSA